MHLICNVHVLCFVLVSSNHAMVIHTCKIKICFFARQGVHLILDPPPWLGRLHAWAG